MISKATSRYDSRLPRAKWANKVPPRRVSGEVETTTSKYARGGYEEDMDLASAQTQLVCAVEENLSAKFERSRRFPIS